MRKALGYEFYSMALKPAEGAICITNLSKRQRIYQASTGAWLVGAKNVRNLIVGRTSPGSAQYDKKMIPKDLIPESDHNKSGLHKSYHIFFLDSFSLTRIF